MWELPPPGGLVAASSARLRRQRLRPVPFLGCQGAAWASLVRRRSSAVRRPATPPPSGDTLTPSVTGSDSDEGARIVLGKSAHVTRLDSCDFTDMGRDRCGFAARV